MPNAFCRSQDVAAEIARPSPTEWLPSMGEGVVGADPSSEVCIMREPIPWPRTHLLLRLIWEKPMLQIAQDLGCDPKTISKRAKVLGLPTPAPGHWKKKVSGLPAEIPREVLDRMNNLDAEAATMVEGGSHAKGRRRRAPGFRKKPERIIWPSKQDLLRRLWTTPATQIARELGCSHQSVSAKGKAWGLPMPGDGYWQRRLAGMPPLIPSEVSAMLAQLESQTG